MIISPSVHVAGLIDQLSGIRTSIRPLAFSDFRLQKLTQVIDCLIVAVQSSLPDHEIEPVLEGNRPRDIDRTQSVFA